MDKTSSQPGLYGITDASPSLSLHFLKCGHCQALSFPAASYGCRHCGAPAGEGQIETRPGLATLRNFVTVHAGITPQIPAPYVVAEIELAPGLLEEGILAVDTEAGLRPGMALQAVAVPDPNAPGHYLCRFAPVAHQEGNHQ